MLNKFMKNKKGFTLIELVVVVAILGVLALLIVPNVTNRISEAKEAVLEANIKVINNAIKMYCAEQGDYPEISGTQEGEKIEELLNKLQTAGYLDANEVTNALKAFENVSITVNTVQNTSKVTSIER